MDHKLTELNLETRTGICSECGPTTWVDKGRGKGRCCITRIKERRKRYMESVKGKTAMARGQKKFYAKHGPSKSPWRKFVKPDCERCGIKPVSIVLMDGHHKDHNRKNNSGDNIESLCAFCHRLVHRGLEHLIAPYRPALPVPEVKEAPVLGVAAPDGQKELDELKAFNKALMADNDKLSKEILAQEAKIQRVARLTDNEKLSLFIRKYDSIKAEVMRRYPDESWS